MNALRSTLNALDKVLNFEVAYAHCDIPCGIYDTHMAQMSAHTVIRMDMLIADATAKPSGVPTTEERAKLIRYVAVKEEHAEIVKHEITVLWGDYFKPDHLKANPELTDLVFNTLKAASKAKQTTDIKASEDLLENVMKISEIFWKTKNIKTKRAKAPYPTEREFVYPQI